MFQEPAAHGQAMDVPFPSVSFAGSLKRTPPRAFARCRRSRKRADASFFVRKVFQASGPGSGAAGSGTLRVISEGRESWKAASFGRPV